MKKDFLYDISYVCKLLNTTSRTLRFYEEKGLIKSTLINGSTRRQYTNDQILHIKNILILRSLGLSIKAIAELQTEKYDLKDAVLSKRAEIYASINSHIKQINLLNEALYLLNSDENIFEHDWKTNSYTEEEIEITDKCTQAILNNDDDILYSHLSSNLKQYMPKDVYRIVKKDTFAPLGKFISVEKICVDKDYPHKIYSYIKFSKLGLMITFVFQEKSINGLWLGYYSTQDKKAKPEPLEEIQ